MVERFLIDTPALIDYLAELMPTNGLAFMDSLFNSHDVSLITLTEVIPLVEPAITDHAILIRRETKIMLPDAVIAATALIRNLTVVSRNQKGFGRVEGLDVYESAWAILRFCYNSGSPTITHLSQTTLLSHLKLIFGGRFYIAVSQNWLFVEEAKNRSLLIAQQHQHLTTHSHRQKLP